MPFSNKYIRSEWKDRKKLLYNAQNGLLLGLLLNSEDGGDKFL
jgi:hypothetical protein